MAQDTRNEQASWLMRALCACLEARGDGGQPAASVDEPAAGILVFPIDQGSATATRALVVCDYSSGPAFQRLWTQLMARPALESAESSKRKLAKLFDIELTYDVVAVFIVDEGLPISDGEDGYRGRSAGGKLRLVSARSYAACLAGWLTVHLPDPVPAVWVLGDEGSKEPRLWSPCHHTFDGGLAGQVVTDLMKRNGGPDASLGRPAHRLVSALMNFAPVSMDTKKPSAWEQVKAVSEAWQGHNNKEGRDRSATGTRHAVSNEIAVDVMTQAWNLQRPAGADPLENCFDWVDFANLQLLRFLYWFPAAESVHAEGLLPWPAKRAADAKTQSPSQIDETLRLIVVDDRVGTDPEKCGKTEGQRLAAVLEPWSGMKVVTTPSIYSESQQSITLSADLLPQRTGQAGKEWERGRTALDPAVAFLDLRLWGDSLGSSGFSQERVIAAHRELARQLKLTRQVKLDCVNSFFDDLALAPRVLSEIDPALPIVIFSSTQQRGVIERLQCLPNVIPANCKPSLGPYPETSDPTVVARAIDAALTRARGMLPARTVWRHACDRWRAREVWACSRFAWDGWWRRADHKARSALFKQDEPEAKRHPARWFREQWLVLALQRNSLALATPWLFLRDWLGETALQQITAGPVEEPAGNHDDEYVSRRAIAGACRVLFRAHYQFDQGWSDTPQDDVLGRMIEAAGFAFVDIVAEFAYPPGPSKPLT